MPVLVADTSALVSLGCAANHDSDPLALCLARYGVVLPAVVVAELRELASYDDAHGEAAATVLDRLSEVEVVPVELDSEFPLDDGENAAVTLANKRDAALLLCDEFNRLGLIHASLVNTRLVTTPTLLAVFVRQEQLSPAEGTALLDAISASRSWDANSYETRARSLLEAD